METLTCLAADLRDTERLAGALAQQVRPGDAILLRGDLGAGKTALIKALVAALGYQGDVTSPTFTIANFYDCPALTVLHVDTYRLTDLAEYRDLGLSDYEADSLTLVEWGDLVAADFPTRLLIEISVDPTTEQRRFALSANAPRWRQLLTDLQTQHHDLITRTD